MAQLITDDDLDGLELRASADPNHHVERAELLLRWATDTESFALDDDVRQAHLLLVAAENLEMAGELDRALALARRAAEASDAVPGEVSSTLVSILLARGERDAAIAEADALRAAGLGEWWPLLAVAEVFELADELALAERWFVIALRVVERDAEHDADDRLTALAGRYRVRRDAGKDEDVLDIETRELAGLFGVELG
ncbi:hypothetical protein ACWKWP_07210 [Agromyces soli]